MERATNLVAEPGERVELLDEGCCGVVQGVDRHWRIGGAVETYYSVWLEDRLLRLRVHETRLRKPSPEQP